MLVRCVANSGADLPPPRFGLYHSEHTRFPVTIGQDYRVHGVMMYRGGVIVLIRDDDGLPNTYPVELFEVVDGTFPDGWKAAFPLEGDQGHQAVFGYPELVDDDDHLRALQEREGAALRVFVDMAAEE
ncbi:hypothetical protein [Actinokineospora pegani]|uniref:hypothetical protein n=1 Tax=Actinokineospora pegani TaxID=2654637 RepID=UPI0012E9A3FF|nr:hypothetical protein [Actinokineospora pegani]